jgi:hypothetical protein
LPAFSVKPRPGAVRAAAGVLFAFRLMVSPCIDTYSFVAESSAS